MSSLSLNNYQYNLSSQIESYVDKIKNKSSRPEDKGFQDNREGNHPFAYYPEAVANYAYSLLNSDVAYNLTSNFSKPSETSASVSSAYQYVGSMGQEPSVLLDFMHRNNQKFDVII